MTLPTYSGISTTRHDCNLVNLMIRCEEEGRYNRTQNGFIDALFLRSAVSSGLFLSTVLSFYVCFAFRPVGGKDVAVFEKAVCFCTRASVAGSHRILLPFATNVIFSHNSRILYREQPYPYY